MPSRLRAEVRPDPQRAHGGVSDLVHGLWQIAHRARGVTRRGTRTHQRGRSPQRAPSGDRREEPARARRGTALAKQPLEAFTMDWLTNKWWLWLGVKEKRPCCVQ